MSGFSDSIVAGIGSLIRTFIKSPNYVAGVTGWSINKDGSAEFNNVTVRGTVEVDATPPSLGKVLINGNGFTVLDGSGNTVINVDTTVASLGIFNAQSITADAFLMPYNVLAPTVPAFELLQSNAHGSGVPTIANIDCSNNGGLQFNDVNLAQFFPNVFIGQAVTSPRADDLFLAPAGLVTGINKSNAATVGTAAELKDGGVGDLQFIAETGRTYRPRYSARCRGTAAPSTMDIYIRAAVSPASPTTASPIIAACSVPINVAGGAGAVTMIAEEEIRIPTDLAAGVYNIAGFYAHTAGAGLSSVDQAGGLFRTLSTTDVGTGS